MKRALVAFLLLVGCPALAAIDPIQDDAHVLTSIEIGQLRSKLLAHRTASDVNIVVVTVDSLDDRSIEEVAIARFRELAIGRAREDNGLLLLLAPVEHKVRVEVGYGMEGEVTDVDATEVIDAMRPALQTSAWNTALTVGVDALIARTTNHQAKASIAGPDFQLIALLLATGFMGLGTIGFMLASRRRQQYRAWEARQARQRALLAEPIATVPYYGRSRTSRRSSSRSTSRDDDDSSRLGDAFGAGLGSGSGSSSYSDSSSSGSFSDSGGSSGGGGSSGDF